MQHKLDVDALLAHLPLFKHLDASQRTLMAQASQQIRVAKHGYVFHRGDPANGLFIVAVGQIKLAIPTQNGHEKVIEFFGAGSAFGEAVMFLDLPYKVQAQALADSLLIWIGKQEIYAALDRDPSFARRMLAGLSLRLHGLIHDIETLNSHNARQRVIRYLLSQPQTAARIQLPVNKNVIASKLGLTPETFSRILQQLSRDGLIEVLGRAVWLRDTRALTQHLDAP